MDNVKLKCSLNDTTILRNLILENPELPVLIFCGEDAWNEEYGYCQAYASSGEVEELTLYGDKWLDKEDYAEELIDKLCFEEKYVGMDDEEFHKMIDKKVEETEFVKAIVLWIG